MASERAGAADHAPRWRIVATIAREGQALTLRFVHTPVTIGGAPTSDVVLGGAHVSRQHSSVTISGGHLLYHDHSSNGSFLNGTRINEQRIEPTDIIVVPPYRLTFALLLEPEHATVELEPSSPIAVPEVVATPGEDTPSRPRQAPAETARGDAFVLRLSRAPGDLSNHRYEFNRSFAIGAVITVGRVAEADVSLNLPSVSRRHAALTLVAPGQWQIADLGSSNGVKVNRQPIESAILADGDEIDFGPDVVAVFEQAPSTADTAPLPAATVLSAAAPDETLSIATRRSSFDSTVTVIAVTGRIDGYNYSVFRDHLVRAIDNGERLLIVDFSLCPFCDHAGLAVVLSIKTALDKRRGRLCLVGLNQMLTEGLALLGLRNMLAIERDEAAGVRRLVSA